MVFFVFVMKNRTNMGLHIILDLFLCDPKMLNSNSCSTVYKKISLMVKQASLTKIAGAKHKFINRGYSFAILLAESHISIHTWPERNRYAAVDIFVCNYTKNNTESAKDIAKKIILLFNPDSFSMKKIKRASALTDKETKNEN